LLGQLQAVVPTADREGSELLNRYPNSLSLSSYSIPRQTPFPLALRRLGQTIVRSNFLYWPLVGGGPWFPTGVLGAAKVARIPSRNLGGMPISRYGNCSRKGGVYTKQTEPAYISNPFLHILKFSPLKHRLTFSLLSPHLLSALITKASHISLNTSWPINNSSSGQSKAPSLSKGLRKFRRSRPANLLSSPARAQSSRRGSLISSSTSTSRRSIASSLRYFENPRYNYIY